MRFHRLRSVILLTLFATASAVAGNGPTLSYSTFFGGRDADFISAIAIGKDGSIYAGGSTHSTNFPLRNAAWTSCLIGPLGSCADAFLLRLAPDGQSLIFSTYIPITNSGSDEVFDIELDPDGNAYVAGMAGSNTGFVAKFTPQGTAVYLKQITGYPLTIALGVAADSKGNAYVTGSTTSTQFALANALQTQMGAPSCTPAGGSPFPKDAFVIKLDALGRTVYSTYLGGNGNDEGTGIVADPDGNVYIAGSTSSTDFPTVNAIQSSYRGGHRTGLGVCDGGDFFLAKLDPTGQQLLYSTYLGGTGSDQAAGIILDSASNPLVYGPTSSGDLPTKGNWPTPFDGTFVAKVSQSNGTLIYAGYVTAGVTRIASDARGLLYLVGATLNPFLPLVQPLQPFGGGNYQDAFLQVLDPGSGRFQFSTYLGSTENDNGSAIAIDAGGSIYVGGSTNSNAFPAINALQRSNAGFNDGFLAQISGAVPSMPPFTMVSSASFTGQGLLAPDLIASGFGEALCAKTTVAGSLPLPLQLDDVTLEITDTAGTLHSAPLFMISPGQINFLVPSQVAQGEARITVKRSQQAMAEGLANIVKIAPSLYAANAGGSGVAAALVTHVKADGSQVHEFIFDETAPAGQRTARPISWATPSEEIVLLLFGTGIRGRTALTAVRAEVGGQIAEVLYAGEQSSYAGLDQVNLKLPRTLAGKGEVPVTLTVDGIATNAVTIRFQ